ncbi:MAG: Phosphatidate cytidylyltransferase [candidate division TM6 bacterium GW2011_GWF2_32_72]|nr:MAG: Phosphatidate cytidylyltransferase [candidate division TM6 bacterium GW2011_GWF2_32_72]
MNKFLKRTITGTILALTLWYIFFCAPIIYLSITFLAILLWILTQEWANLFKPSTFLFWILTPIYPILPFIFLILLNQNPSSRFLIFIMFLIVASFDTGGYLVGKTIGKYKIIPKISPKKTWEGFFGGCILALISILTYRFLMNRTENLILIIIITLITCLISFAGDAFESWLKRLSKIKDSSYILPGHGGFMDRLDGAMFAAVFFYIFQGFLITVFR